MSRAGWRAAAPDRQAGLCGPAGPDPATEPAEVARKLGLCRETVDDQAYGRLLAGLLADPVRARDQLAARLHDSWTSLVSPFWSRIRALLERDIDERSRMLARHGLLRVLCELHPKIRWTKRGLSRADGSGASSRSASADSC